VASNIVTHSRDLAIITLVMLITYRTSVHTQLCSFTKRLVYLRNPHKANESHRGSADSDVSPYFIPASATKLARTEYHRDTGFLIAENP